MKHLLSLLLLFNFFIGSGQDSLFEKTITHYQDNARMEAMKGNFDGALGYVDSLFALAGKEKSIRYKVIGNSYKGKIYQRMGKNEASYEHFQKALMFLDDVSTKELDENFTINSTRADVYKSIVKLFHRQNMIDSAQVYGDKIHALPCEEGTLWSKDYYILVLQEQGDFKKALRVCDEIINCYSTRPEHKVLLSKVLLSMSGVYTELDQHKESIACIDSSLQIAEAINDSLSMLIAYDQLASGWMAMNNNRMALSWQLKCVQIAEAMPKYITIKRENTVLVKVPLASSYAHLSTLYIALN